jgi:hypothetical protein
LVFVLVIRKSKFWRVVRQKLINFPVKKKWLKRHMIYYLNCC